MSFMLLGAVAGYVLQHATGGSQVGGIIHDLTPGYRRINIQSLYGLSHRLCCIVRLQPWLQMWVWSCQLTEVQLKSVYYYKLNQFFLSLYSCDAAAWLKKKKGGKRNHAFCFNSNFSFVNKWSSQCTGCIIKASISIPSLDSLFIGWTKKKRKKEKGPFPLVHACIIRGGPDNLVWTYKGSGHYRRIPWRRELNQ